MSIDVKRAYEAPAKSDGCRILVDRIWPRGITKDDLQVDAWLKDLAPSTGLRKWFGHDPNEMGRVQEAVRPGTRAAFGRARGTVARAKAGHVTLVFAAKDSEHNNAVALKQQLELRLTR